MLKRGQDSLDRHGENKGIPSPTSFVLWVGGKDAHSSLSWPLMFQSSIYLPSVLPGASAVELMGWQRTFPLVFYGPSSYKVPDKLYIIQPCLAVIVKIVEPNRERELGKGVDWGTGRV